MTSHLYRDTAVVLRTYKLGESDKIVVLLTHDNGKVRAVARGVRKTRSKFGGRLEPLSHVSLLISRGRELDHISQAESIESLSHLLDDLDVATQGLAMVEAVDLLAPDREPVPHLYRMLVGALRTLAEQRSPLVVPAFYWKLLAAEGVRPELDLCVSCGRDDALVAFDLDQGGSLCRTCRRGAPVSADAFALMRQILGGRLNDALAADVTTAHHEVQVLATKAVEHHLERRLRSIAMFERTS